MKLSILQQDLLPALQAVSRSVGLKPALPVLGNILLQTEEGKLKLAATNLEIGVIKQVNCKAQEEGAITVPARTILEIVTPLSGEELELEADESQLKISTKSFNANINGIPATEFPSIPSSSSDSAQYLPSKILQKSLQEITFAAAVDEGRPILTGILTDLKPGVLEMVATDGFRLARRTIKLESDSKDSLKILIPRRTFEEVAKIIGEDLKEDEDKVSISTSDNQNQIIFKAGQTLVSSRLIEGQFPAWEKIIPTSFENRTIIDRMQLLKACKLASVFAKGESNVIKIQIESGKIKVSSAAKELGAQETQLEGQSEGGDINIAFNSKFLLEALNASPTTQLAIEFSGSLSPALIKPIGEEGLEYVIMPVRLS